MSGFDTHTNLLIGTVKIAPSPAASGETLTLMPGDGTRFASNQPVTMAPPNKEADHGTAEIGYLRAVDGDDLTITRACEGTLPMQVAAGWKVYGSITAKSLTDIEETIDELGMPAGGSAGQVLAKSSSTDYATHWADPSTGMPDATISTKGILRLAGDFAGTASSPRVKARAVTVTVGPSNADYVTDGTSDQAEIQSAVDYVAGLCGGTVYIREGDYYLSGSVYLKSEVEVHGAGMYSTRIHAAAGWGSGALFSATTFTPANTLKHFILRDMEIEGSNMATTPYQIGRKGVDGHNFENCMFSNLYIHDTPATGLGIDNLYRVLIDHCYIKNCGTPHPPATDQGSNGVGLGTGGMTHESVIVTNCITEGTKNSGYLLEDLESIVDGQKLYIFANNISIGDFTGFSASGCDNVIIANNQVYNPTNNGVRAIDFVTHYVDNITIANNEIYGATSFGILLESNCTNFKVQGNTVQDGTVEGILVRGRTGVVSGNIVHDNGKHGIFFGGGSGGPDITNVLISNNIVYNNSKITPNSDGIRLDGAQVNMTQISITGNRCFDNQGTKTQRYGIILSGTKSGGAHDSILVGFNSLQGNKTGAFLQSSFTATNVSFWKNFGATNDNSLVPIDMASNKITSLANGTLATDAVNKGQLDSAGWSVVPASSTATGVVGQKAYDSTYLYVCTATNTWMRVAMSTW